MDRSSRGGVGQVDGFSLQTVRAPETRRFYPSFVRLTLLVPPYRNA